MTRWEACVNAWQQQEEASSVSRTNSAIGSHHAPYGDTWLRVLKATEPCIVDGWPLVADAASLVDDPIHRLPLLFLLLLL